MRSRSRSQPRPLRARAPRMRPVSVPPARAFLLGVFLVSIAAATLGPEGSESGAAVVP